MASEEARKAVAEREWRCFFCDEVFTDRRKAWEHFGEEGCATDAPACIDPLREDEKARNKELREAIEYATKMRRECEEADEKVGLLESYRAEIGRLFGTVGGAKASTPHQAWLVLDSARGEILSLQERVLELEKHQEGL